MRHLLSAAWAVLTLLACGCGPQLTTGDISEAPPRHHRTTSTPSTGGELMVIVDEGEVYSTINQTDCLAWPSEEMKRIAGHGAWQGYYPANGQEGVVVHRAQHCDSTVEVVILDIQGRLVPIGRRGVRPKREMPTTP